jgi:hypothetical protein
MNEFKRFISWQFTALFFIMFAASNAFATPIKPIMAHIEGTAPINIGEKTFIPVQIDRLAFKLKSAKISFKINAWLPPLEEGISADSVKIEETIIDISKLTSFPYTVKVTAKYGNDFEVKNATGSVIEIGFKDV